MRRRLAFAVALFAIAGAFLVAGCGSAAAPAPSFRNPLIAGNFPDPSVMRDGDTYYLASTSRSWLPGLTLFRSTDLVNWERIGGVLPRAPTWTAGYYWAPEFEQWGGVTRVYYAALTKQRIHCIGVATSASPAGPYRDAGHPILCPSSGAIDADVATDAHGTRYLIYRRFNDGGGIFARRLSADGLRVTGPAHELLKPAAGDDRVVEGPDLVRHGSIYYLFFAGGNCCKPPCDYFEGVARSSSLLGPYTRDRRRVLTGTSALRCPGHGTLFDDQDGREWFVHHAVLPDDPVNARRQPVLEPVRWGSDGWPVLGSAGRPVTHGGAPLNVDQQQPGSMSPDLTAPLDAAWEWPWDRVASASTGPNGLTLRGNVRTAEFARQEAALDVDAQVTAESHGCAAGLAGIEGAENDGEAIGIEVSGGRARVWRGTYGPGRTIATAAVPTGAAVTLGVSVRGSRTLRFFVTTGGQEVPVGPAVATARNHRVIRVGLTCRGPITSSATFRDLTIQPVG